MSDETPEIYPFDEEQQWVNFDAVDNDSGSNITFSACEKSQSTLSKPIEYYCNLVEHVFNAFLTSYERYADNDEEAAMVRAFSLGNRLKDFVTIVLPYHEQYNVDCWDIRRVQSIEKKLDEHIYALNQISISRGHSFVHGGKAVSSLGGSVSMLDLPVEQRVSEEGDFFHSDPYHSFGDFTQDTRSSRSHDRHSMQDSSDACAFDQKFKDLKLLASDDTTFCSSDASEAFLEPQDPKWTDRAARPKLKNEGGYDSPSLSGSDVAFLQNTFMYEMADNIQYEIDMSSKSRKSRLCISKDNGEDDFVGKCDNSSDSGSTVSDGSFCESYVSYPPRNTISACDGINRKANEISAKLGDQESLEVVSADSMAIHPNFHYLMNLWREKERTSTSNGRC